MLVSPAEPPSLRVLGEVSSLCETMGADFLLFTREGVIAIQRKEVKDLVASIRSDDRFQREVGQLTTNGAARCILLVEGDFRFDSSGNSLTIRYGGAWTRKSWHGIQMSVQYRGIWVVRTDSMEDTANWLLQAQTWFDKAEHLSFAVRPKIKQGVWEDAERIFWLRVLQSFDGISAVTAGAIYDQAKRDGVELLGWQVDREWLLSVPGVGPGRAEKLMSAFTPKVVV